MEASRLSLRLFVEGQEVPVIGASCSYADGAPATAQIQVVATDQLWEIEPRALVCLFYYHSGSEGMGQPTSGEGHGNFRWGEGYNIKWGGAQDPRHWKLLFMGTLIGIGFSKSGTSRNGILQCADPSELLDQIMQHGTNYQRGGLAQIENAFLGTNMRSNTSYTSVDKDLTGNLENWFTGSEVDGEMNLAAGIQRAYREIFFAGNIWYSRQFNRLRIGDMVAALDGDKSSSNLLSLRAFKKFLKERVGEQQGLISARQMIDLLNHPILYNYTTIPCPMFDPSAAHIGLHSTEANSGDLADTLGKVICEYENWKNAGLNYIVFTPDSQFFPPPCSNLIFPHMYENFSFSRSFTREPTRALLRTEDLLRPRTYISASAPTGAAVGQLVPPVRRTVMARRLNDRLYAPDFESFSALLDKGSTGGYLARLHTVILPHEFFVGPNIYFGAAYGMGAYASKQARRAYLSFFADYTYWRVRLGSRSGSINMGFTPNLIPGQSAVIFDRDNKHFVAYINSLTHTVNQNGGTTSLSLVAVREHDEDYDLEGTGKSQEDIIFGSLDPDGDGTKDSFYDTRYGVNSIGSEVYTPLFGTNSIIDHYDDLLSSFSGTTVYTADTKTVANAIELMYFQYKRVVATGSNLSAWTQGYTHRPKANLLDILGFDPQSPSWTGFPDSDQSGETYSTAHNYTSTTDPGLRTGSRPVAYGFMEHAISEGEAAKLTYDSKDRSTITTTRTETIDVSYTSFEPLNEDGDAAITVNVTETITKVIPSTRTVEAGETGISYDLDSEVAARKSGVLVYANSLFYRGLKG